MFHRFTYVAAKALASLPRPRITRRELATCILAFGVVASTLYYFVWRTGVANWSAWWIALPLLVAELFGAMHALGLHYTIWPRKSRPLCIVEDPTRRPIFVLVPTVNEGPSVLEPTLRAALTMRARYLAAHPDAQVTLAVCNDGRVAGAPDWQATEALAATLGIRCVTRTQPGGAKAGNVEHARQMLGATGDALLVLFDADQIAEPDFLLKTVPYFGDPGVGWVQTGQYYRNLDNPVARWSDDQQGLFYRVLCPGKGRLNAAFICGTNVVIRAAALDEIGGFPQHTLTEDFAASVDLNRRWRSVYLSEILARGLGPMDLNAYFGQQRRWAIGTLSVLGARWRDLLLPGRGRLDLGQRVQYLLSCTHFLSGLRDVAYIAAPLALLLGDVPAVVGADPREFLVHFAPYWLLTQIALWHVAWNSSGLRGIVLGFGSFPVLVGAAMTVLLGRSRRTRFVVTAKRRGTDSDWRKFLPHAALAAICLVALARGASLLTQPGQSAAVLISVLWLAYTLVMLGAFLWMCLLDQRAAWQVQQRAGQRLRLVELTQSAELAAVHEAEAAA